MDEKINVRKIREKYRNKEFVEFKVESFSENNFLGSCEGVLAEVNKNFMPWTYKNLESWKAIQSYMIGKTLQASIYTFRINPLVVVLNCRNSQELKFEPIEHNWYNGIVITKKEFGVFIDIGFDNDWINGNKVGLLYKTKNKGDIDINVGDILYVRVKSYDVLSERLSFDQGEPEKKVVSGDPLEIIDTIQIVKVFKTSNGKRYRIDGYNCQITHGKTVENIKISKKQLKKTIKTIKVNDEIKCRIVNYSKRYNRYKVEWLDIPKPKIKLMHYADTKRLENKYPYSLHEKIFVIAEKSETGKISFVTDKNHKVRIHFIINGISASTYQKQKIFKNIIIGDKSQVIITDFLRTTIFVDLHINIPINSKRSDGLSHLEEE